MLLLLKAAGVIFNFISDFILQIGIVNSASQSQNSEVSLMAVQPIDMLVILPSS